MTNRALIERTQQIQIDVAKWLAGLRVSPGRYAFCKEGSLVATTGQQALFTTCFAVRIAKQIGIWDTWEKAEQQACIDFIRSFQRSDGFFYDPWLGSKTRVTFKDLVKIVLKRSTVSEVFRRKALNIRAETRQATATLLLAGSSPVYQVPLEVSTQDEVAAYIKRLNWRNPWAAGSHFSHLIMSLALQKDKETAELLTAKAFEILAEYYDPETGCWYSGNPTNAVKLNGAMKIMTAFSWAQMHAVDTSVLLNFALDQPFERDGCFFFNKLFVVQQSYKYSSSHVLENIISFFLEAFVFIDEFFCDGAFTFFPQKSQTHYYGVQVASGLRTGDLHGTMMMTWALAIIRDIILDGEDTVWFCPRV